MHNIFYENIVYDRKEYVRVRLNLQFFAEGQGGEKTEPATPKKLSDARNEGQVAKSKEIANCAALVALFLLLKLWVGNMGTQFLNVFGFVYNRIPESTSLLGGTSADVQLSMILGFMMKRIMIILLPIFILGFMVAFVSDLVQVKWNPTTKPLKPKLSKISPLNGVKRIFSVNSLVELLKAILKIIIIAYVTYSYVVGRKEQLLLLYDIDLFQAIRLIGDTVVDLGLRISYVYIVLAAADYMYTKFKFAKDMRMTKQEVKEEYRNAEGNPEIKGKIRAKMREVSQRRMMQALPEADVVITNPTHYAVAIKYDPETAPAPVVLAKGEDYLAQKIKEVAKDNKIEIVENKPLARMLYANVDIGQQVPPELYTAVADVLAYVYHLQGRTQ